jgi:hypothetical protein
MNIDEMWFYEVLRLNLIIHKYCDVYDVHATNNYGIRRMIGFINSSLQTHTRLHLYTS